MKPENSTPTPAHGRAKTRGYLLAALAAAAYGTNPAFAIPLYAEGMNANSVLLFRYLLGVPLLALMLLARGRKLTLRRHEIMPSAILGILMALSSLALFESYNYINSGVASTLLFVYPVMVALMMIFFYHERFQPSTAVCLLLMGAGLMMLMKTPGGGAMSLTGILLVMLSALTYAIYIVMVNVSRTVRQIPATRLLMHTLLWGCLVFIFMMPLGSPLTIPSGAAMWTNVGALAIIPTVISLMFTTMAIQTIGSTPTAILGALEPVTAVVLSVLLLGQPISSQEIAGGLLIVVATTIVVASEPVDKALLRVRKMFPPVRGRRSNKER